MKRSHVLWAALIAVFTSGVVAATSASALEFLLAEWLLNGAAVTGELAVSTSGELTLEDTKVPLIGKATMLCSGILDGRILANGEALIETVLSLTAEAISKVALSEPGLACTNVTGCSEPLVFAVHLPWSGLIELMEDGGSFFVELIFEDGAGAPSWVVVCHGLANFEDECQMAETIVEIKNTETDVEATLSEAFTELAGLKLATCSQGGAESGIIETRTGDAVLLATHNEGGTLSVSSTG